MKHFLAALLAAGFLAAVLPAAPEAKPEGVKPINLEKLNTEKDEDDPHVSSGGRLLFYSSNAKGNYDVLVSQRTATGQTWPAGKPMLDINSKADTRSVFLTTDGVYPQRLYFASNKDLDKKGDKGDNYDITFVTKQLPRSDFTFEEGFPYCTPMDELHPWITTQGQFYFSRKTEEGWRVFVSSRPKGGGQFGEPKLVDLPTGFHHATLTPDGLTMYMQGPLENDRWGLFRTHKTGTNWSKPEALESLNSADAPTGDRSPNLSRDGAMLYFASDRPGGKGGLDIWAVPTAQLQKKPK